MATYQPRDKFHRKARARGLPSRAAFKIEELLERTKLTRANARVVDLGCAPGGWLAILARAVGSGGRVVGVDLAECKSPAPCVVTLVGDIRDPKLVAIVAGMLGGLAELVTSDLAPKLSGIGPRDEARSSELLEAALQLARQVLKPGGAMIAKLFMSSGFKESVAGFQRYFRAVEVTRTKTSRPGSAELYLVARDFLAAEN